MKVVGSSSQASSIRFFVSKKRLGKGKEYYIILGMPSGSGWVQFDGPVSLCFKSGGV